MQNKLSKCQDRFTQNLCKSLLGILCDRAKVVNARQTGYYWLPVNDGKKVISGPGSARD